MIRGKLEHLLDSVLCDMLIDYRMNFKQPSADLFNAVLLDKSTVKLESKDQILHGDDTVPPI